MSYGRITERKRMQLSQELHDWVIEKTVENCYGKVKEKGRKIYTNPNQEKNFDGKNWGLE